MSNSDAVIFLHREKEFAAAANFFSPCRYPHVFLVTVTILVTLHEILQPRLIIFFRVELIS